MAEKNIKTRIIHKHDTEENWNKATNFIPKQGEIIVYDIDSSHSYERIKIGDGTTNVNSLPYVSETVVDAKLSSTSENPVQNKVIYDALDKKIEEPSGNGLVRKYMSGLYVTMGVDTTMPDSPTEYSIPTTKLLKDYVEDNSHPLQLSDTDKTKSVVLLQHNYDSETQTEKYIARSIDTNNLSESGLAAYNIPTSKAVISWVKAYIESLNQSGGA